MSNIIPRLNNLSAEINESHERICAYVLSTNDLAKKAIEEAVYCGALLNQVRDNLEHGQIGTWLAEHCPMMSHTTAYKYMRLEKLNHELKLTEAGNLRTAYLLAGIISDANKPSKPRSDNTDIGGVLTIENVIGSNWVRWVKKNFEPRIQDADLSLLYRWHEHLVDVVEVDKRVVERILKLGGTV